MPRYRWYSLVLRLFLRPLDKLLDELRLCLRLRDELLLCFSRLFVRFAIAPFNRL